MKDNKDIQLNEIRKFYNSVYYKDASASVAPERHHRSLARKLNVKSGDDILDVACGVGQWLAACGELGARTSGVDISGAAIDICKEKLQGDFYEQPAEILPFSNSRFDLVTCLGSLEHFVNPTAALQEMVRVAKPEAKFLLLVPNEDFLTRKLGLFAGTYQVDAKEEVMSLEEWNSLFDSCGLNVVSRWKDLHILSYDWVFRGRWYMIPLRLIQALVLPLWPLKWQYQVYFYCEKNQ